jgi:signal transduction histidine kinase
MVLAFAASVTFVVVLLSWWVFYQIRESGAERDREVLRLERLGARATAFLNHVAEPVDPDSVLVTYFAGLVYVPHDGERGLRHTAVEPVGPGEVRPDPAEIQEAEERQARLVRMFATEGGVFLLVQLLGAAVVVEAMRRESRLQRMQENFLSAVTHELRTPITAIRLYVDALGRPDLPRARSAQALDRIQEDLARLDGLVANLLAAGRVGDRHFRPTPVLLDLAEVTREILAEIGPGLGREPEVAAPDGAVPVRADRRYLETILRNLVQNAVKYAVDDPRLEVTVSRAGSRKGVVSVTDHGVGFAPGEEKRIFERFYRAGDEMVRRTVGSGLGLYLAREMARELGGDLTAHSDGEGRGATFRVTVPLEGRP